MRFFHHCFNLPQVLGNGLNLLPVININRILNRNILYTKYAGRVIPELCNSENRFWVQNGPQIKSKSSGMLYEFNPLHSTLVILKQRGCWARYLQKHVDMALKRTR